MSEKYIGGSFSTSDIRSFLSKDSQVDKFFPEKLRNKKRLFFETGADSLAAILKEIEGNSTEPLNLYFPKHYCFDTIERVKLKSGIKNVFFYEQLDFEIDNAIKQAVVVLLHLNCFQESISHGAKRLKEKAITIEDFVHCPFELNKLEGDYGFNSLRKVCTSNVSVTYLNNDFEAEVAESVFHNTVEEAMNVKKQFLENHDLKLESEFLKLFKQAEGSLKVKEIYFAQENDVKQINRIDFDKLISTRRQNHNILISLLKNADLSFLNGDYLFLMAKSESRDELRTFLFTQNISAPIHWLDSGSELSKKIISFPIDQRYNKVDMNRLAKAIIGFRK